MTFDSLVSALRDTDTMLPLLGSVLAGALIGADREFLGKQAGLRTHTLVCFASALMTLLGLRMAEWTMACLRTRRSFRRSVSLNPTPTKAARA
jgi:putative Mg2+ transporter-C (MgtC) family protein